MQLPNLNEVAIIHYGCSSFDSSDDTIYWIGVIHYHKGEKKYELWDGDEESILIDYSNFLAENDSKIFIHWSMNSPKYGFLIFKIKAKSFGITNSVQPPHLIDLSEYLKDKYGVNYTPREGGRLNHLASYNRFTGKKAGIEVKTRSEAADRMELIFSIVQAEKQGSLIVDTEAIINPYPLLWNDKCYQLFIYLWQNYIIDRITQANILRVMYFLRDLPTENNGYVFRCTIEQFKNHIYDVYGIQITNHDIPSNYPSKKAILNNLRIQFEHK
jgi:hypothetical protein